MKYKKEEIKMNKLKKMVIDNMKKAHKESCLADKDFIIGNLMPEINKLCDRIIDRLLENDNVDMKAKFDYDMQHQCPVLYFDIIHHPISQEQVIDAIMFIKNRELLNKRMK
ncbi:MAG TPA: hypothetical protein VJU85_05170 [Nitrososphaeraceae archaeon]|nr:hypothetical protein [Nitrososphaeraceae archaeon]